MCDSDRICAICGKRMRRFKGIYMCLECNDKYGDYYNYFSKAVSEFKRDPDGADKVMIECPGASIYDEANQSVIRGVKWNDSRDYTKGCEVIGQAIYAPGHEKKRLIDRDAVKRIGRCKACQDFTVRMRIFNNQKAKGEYSHESPLLPKNHPKGKFDPRSLGGDDSRS